MSVSDFAFWLASHWPGISICLIIAILANEIWRRYDL